MEDGGGGGSLKDMLRGKGCNAFPNRPYGARASGEHQPNFPSIYLGGDTRSWKFGHGDH